MHRLFSPLLALLALGGCIVEPAPNRGPISPAAFPHDSEPLPPEPALLLDQFGVATTTIEEPRWFLLTGGTHDALTWEFLRNETSGFTDADLERTEAVDLRASFVVIAHGVTSMCKPGQELVFRQARIVDGAYFLEYDTVTPITVTQADVGTNAGGPQACYAACGARGIAIIDRFLPDPVRLIAEETTWHVRTITNEDVA